MMGDILMLRDGSEVKFIQLDPESGWPIVQQENGVMIAIDPAIVEGGFCDRDD